MSQLTQRNIDILRIIIEEYLKTGSVLWSKALLKKYDLWVSPATVRNDMARLEILELIYQPYNSAGRLPTAKGIRAFVNYLMQDTPDHFLGEEKKCVKENFRDFSDYIHKIVYELWNTTGEVAFCIVPESSVLEYVWLSHFIEKNYRQRGDEALNIIKMFEDKRNFIQFIENMPKYEGVNVFIGEENILPFLKDYTVILKSFLINGLVWYIGIVWSMKMDYSFNISAVRGII